MFNVFGRSTPRLLQSADKSLKDEDNAVNHGIEHELRQSDGPMKVLTKPGIARLEKKNMNERALNVHEQKKKPDTNRHNRKLKRAQ